MYTIKYIRTVRIQHTIGLRYLWSANVCPESFASKLRIGSGGLAEFCGPKRPKQVTQKEWLTTFRGHSSTYFWGPGRRCCPFLWAVGSRRQRRAAPDCRAFIPAPSGPRTRRPTPSKGVLAFQPRIAGFGIYRKQHVRMKRTQKGMPFLHLPMVPPFRPIQAPLATFN